ncbi:hypothetical protein LJB95_02675 [Paludibacteraceae bacterium OttesenSCG-928-F17]|nr:hypothetical protein [Paludibacteraceae bacterium OttesenSCG-928-F17]
MKKKIENLILKIFTSATAEKITRFIAWFIFGYFIAHAIVRLIQLNY